MSFSNRSDCYSWRINWLSLVEETKERAINFRTMILFKFKSLRDLEKAFPDEKSCIDYLEKVI
jgi:hypothetical protein